MEAKSETLDPPKAAPTAPERPFAFFHWSTEKYLEAVRAGILTEEDKLELIFGRIIQKMSINEAHAATMQRVQRYFYSSFMDRFEIRTQNPIVLPNDSVPEPDLALVDLKEDGYLNAHPRAEEVHLVIEVSDRTLAKDRGVKAEAYARAGIPEYWIVNLKNATLELNLEPDVEDGSYRKRTVFGREEKFTSPRCGEIKVSDLIAA